MMMGEALVLGVVQGLTEFLPISSSAHLVLLPQMAGWRSVLLNSLAFDVALHFGTLLAVLSFFWQDIIRMAAAFLKGFAEPRIWRETDARLAWYIILGTLPAVAVAVFFKPLLETVFRAPLSIACCLLGFSLIMIGAEILSKRQKPVTALQWQDALWIGAAQALALMPGVSRSGSTIAAGLFLGFKREEAARYSFLLGIPAIVGATVMQIRELTSAVFDQSWFPLLGGAMAAGLTGYFCIKFLLAYLQRRTLYIFIFYRLLLGTAVIFWLAQTPSP
ncbi:undecaprenyl-diphosphatase UppP [candidate division FCPU426 bacterium]|nr:undecaprenyl-diphosphatase UppP [candidate division FCPU426 bacterium]